MFNRAENRDETNLLNKYLLIGWGVIAAVLVVTYAAEVIKGAFLPSYYAVFCLITVIPFLSCFAIFRRNREQVNLRYWIFFGYFLMYGFVLLTGHTNLVFTYIFPLMSLIILYHDSRLVLQVGVVSLALNIAFILKNYFHGNITLTNSRDYEIQIALIVLCFSGCYMATKVYDQISRLNKEKEQEVLRLQEERIILEERNKYALLDALTGLGNRRKYDEYMDALKEDAQKKYYIVMCDINGLKKANDTIGHVAGDELIAGMAHCIKTAFDGEADEAFRMGGDEFVVVSSCDEAAFGQKLDKLRENISLWRGIHVHSLSAALGFVLIDRNVRFEDALKCADEQMYDDKNKYYEQQQNDRRRR